MKLWMIFLLMIFISEAKAASTIEEDGPKNATYRPEPIDPGGRADLKEELLEDAPMTVINANDFAGPPGGGLIKIDQKLLKPQDPPLSWWKRCCNWFSSFF